MCQAVEMQILLAILGLKHEAVDERIYHKALNISGPQLISHFAHKIQTLAL
jgi:hypothetical protein